MIRRLIEELRITGRLLLHTPKVGTTTTDYEAYWKTRLLADPGPLNDFQRERAEWTASRLRPGAKVMDVGCGDGGILAHLRAVAGVDPLGADMSPYALEYLARRGIPGVLLDLNAGGISALPETDHLLLFEVLEHVQNPEALVREALEKARVSVFFSVPNTGYFPYRLRFLFGRFPVQWRVHPGEHVRFWTFRDARWWLRELGLEGRFVLRAYRGVPWLNRLFPGLFGMGLIGEIYREALPRNG